MSGGLAALVRNGDRRGLARAITLVESARDDHRLEAIQLIDELLPTTGGAARIGISGAPGVGKSTLIEALGLHIVGAGLKLAVLAVDPSSALSGGSILGDKTRMGQLGREPGVFIRPSPAGKTLGGVARRTREGILLCEAAGFDVVLVETVGVGQSEVAVADLVDLFLLVASPSGGDELQGIKRGIMEVADIVVVNKADGDLLERARQACTELRSALQLLRPRRPGAEVPVSAVSAATGAGIAELWAQLAARVEQLRASGELAEIRADQAVAWMWNELEESLVSRLRQDSRTRAVLPQLEHEVRSGRRSPSSAVTELLESLQWP